MLYSCLTRCSRPTQLFFRDFRQIVFLKFLRPSSGCTPPPPPSNRLIILWAGRIWGFGSVSPTMATGASGYTVFVSIAAAGPRSRRGELFTTRAPVILKKITVTVPRRSFVRTFSTAGGRLVQRRSCVPWFFCLGNSSFVLRFALVITKKFPHRRLPVLRGACGLFAFSFFFYLFPSVA